MGANFDYDVIVDPELKLSDEEIEKKADGIFEERAYNYGHAGYTGTLAEKIGLGVKIYRQSVQETEDIEAEYIQNFLDNDKWGQADVVPIKNVGWIVGGWCSD